MLNFKKYPKVFPSQIGLYTPGIFYSIFHENKKDKREISKQKNDHSLLIDAFSRVIFS